MKFKSLPNTIYIVFHSLLLSIVYQVKDVYYEESLFTSIFISLIILVLFCILIYDKVAHKTNEE